MEKLTIIFGGPKELYAIHARFFSEFCKRFKCSIIEVKPFQYSVQIKGIEINLLFAFHSMVDEAYKSNKSYFKQTWGINIPPSVNALGKYVKKSKIILFFGVCGSLAGKKNQLFTPNKFYRLFFKHDKISKGDVARMRPKAGILYNNILNSAGVKKGIITTNITMRPSSLRNGNDKLLIKYCTVLKKWGELYDKEVYMVVSRFRKLAPIGILIQSSDIIRKKQYLNGQLKINWQKFNRACIKAISSVLKKYYNIQI